MSSPSNIQEKTSNNTKWTVCPACKGRGEKSKKLRKKDRLAYKEALEIYNKAIKKETPPTRPKRHVYPCSSCDGSGLIKTVSHPVADVTNYPHIAIIGAGIGGVALAVACLHRGIPFTLYERDQSFDARSQGYGLTLQQARKALKGFGLWTLEEGIVSTRHLVHTTDGKLIGEWGMRKGTASTTTTVSKHSNIHIARQSLRLALLNQLEGTTNLQWGHQLVAIENDENNQVALSFQTNKGLKQAKADLVVGADGIRSTVRSLVLKPEPAPLQYLDCMVILGICMLADIEILDRSLIDGATVFQTVNGKERVYMMPYTTDAVMWQLSFPISEVKAKTLNAQGAQALKEEAVTRTSWHDPIPQIIAATEISKISGYPVYDRALLDATIFQHKGPVTLLGDAAHPMSPFKGQGANQALLDALALARGISLGCRPQSQWRATGIRSRVLSTFETEMLARSATKVKDSARAARLLHSDRVLLEGDTPRGR